jgi:hypothetical protein
MGLEGVLDVIELADLFRGRLDGSRVLGNVVEMVRVVGEHGGHGDGQKLLELGMAKSVLLVESLVVVGELAFLRQHLRSGHGDDAMAFRILRETSLAGLGKIKHVNGLSRAQQRVKLDAPEAIVELAGREQGDLTIFAGENLTFKVRCIKSNESLQGNGRVLANVDRHGKRGFFGQAHHLIEDVELLLRLVGLVGGALNRIHLGFDFFLYLYGLIFLDL